MDIEKINLNKHQHIAKLISGFLSDSLTEEQIMQLNQWRQESVINEKFFNHMVHRVMWSAKLERQKCLQTHNNESWLQIRQKIDNRSKKSLSSIKILQYAALFLLPIGIVTLLFLKTNTNTHNNSIATPALTLSDGSIINLTQDKNHRDSVNRRSDFQIKSKSIHYNANKQPHEIHKLEIPIGYTYRLELADGSIIHLNSFSSISYPNYFIGNERRIKLQGECFCEIAKDSLRPFIIEVDKLQLTVLGTSFNIRSYQNEKKVLTTLVSGKVEVKSELQTIVLQPGDQSSFDKQSSQIQVHKVDVRESIGWRYNRFVFDNKSLKYIFTELEKYYNVHFFYSTTFDDELTYSLDLKRYHTIDTILQFIKETSNIDYSIKNNTITIY